MSCTLSAGIQLGCRNSVGGLSKIYIGNFSDSETYSVDANNQITGVTSASTYYVFECRPQTASFNETINSSVENGTLFFTQELTLSFDKLDVSLRNQIYLLAQSQMRVIILDQNQTYRLLGKVNGCDLTAGTLPTGQNYGDKNGAELTLTSFEPQPASFMSTAAFGNITTSI